MQKVNVVISIMVSDVANKFVDQKYGFKVALDDEQRAYHKQKCADVICEISSQDGDSTTITAKEAANFTSAMLDACVHYKDINHEFPSLDGMDSYYRENHENFGNFNPANPDALRQEQIRNLRDYNLDFRENAGNYGEKLECTQYL